MTQWRKTVFLKDLLGDDSSDAATRIAAEGFVKRLKRLSEYESDYELEQIVSEFEDIAHADSTGNDVFGGRFTLCDWFNAVLSSLYDWADAERIWIGGDRPLRKSFDDVRRLVG